MWVRREALREIASASASVWCTCLCRAVDRDQRAAEGGRLSWTRPTCSRVYVRYLPTYYADTHCDDPGVQGPREVPSYRPCALAAWAIPVEPASKKKASRRGRDAGPKEVKTLLEKGSRKEIRNRKVSTKRASNTTNLVEQTSSRT